jgi:ribosomal protein L5
MRSQHSLEEIAELYGLLENIKKEYENGIHSVLRKSNPELFSNPHTIPKLKKISINRGLGLAAQNTNILKKSIIEFTRITGQKPLITRAKKAVAGFKIRENMELGLSSTLRGEKMYNFLTKLIFFTFAQIRDFRGAMQGRADKGLFITTGSFTREAVREATRDGAPPIDLIDGELLCEKLKELKLGINTQMIEQVEIKQDWFEKL